jgi:hypothetical protein
MRTRATPPADGSLPAACHAAAVPAPARILPPAVAVLLDLRPLPRTFPSSPARGRTAKYAPQAGARLPATTKGTTREH